MAATPGPLPPSPLETPAQDPNPAAGQSNLSVPKDKNAVKFLQSPTPSFAESFSTAFTSPDDEVEEATRLGLSSLAPPQSLRKSVSVDSFNPHGSRTQLNSSPEPFHSNVHNTVPVTQRRSDDAQVWPGRHNESLNALRRDHESSSPPDSDIDRYDPISLPAIERFRHPSLKSQDPSKAPLRPGPGDLSLPSRTQSSSAVASSSSHGPREREYFPSIPSPSFQASSRRGSVFPSPTVGRVRSGSLGYNPPTSSKRTIINPYISPSIRSSSPKQDITLVVFGTMGCGKSTVVKNAFSGWALAESTVASESTHSSFSRYIRRTGSLMIDQVDQSPFPGGSIILDVFEVEIQTTSSGLVEWPQGLPAIDGIVICYDSSTTSSYQPIESILKGYRSMILPILVLSCKADLPHEVDSNEAVEMLKGYHTGLIEVSSTTDLGKKRMDQSFQHLLKAIFRQRGPDRIIDDRNPATPPNLFRGPPWSDSPNHTPTSSPTIPSQTGVPSLNVNSHAPSDIIDSAQTLDSVAPLALPRMDSMGDSLPENQTPGSQGEDVAPTESEDTHNHNDLENSPGLPDESPGYLSEVKINGAKKEPRPAQWADLEDLLDKLLFLAVSGDDPTFTVHFLLTYRRFATPRSVLLAMQKRMRQLDNPCGDPMFACFAQMRICQLLETWIRDYPHDFAVKGTAGALNALIKSIISKTHLLHYGSEFLPFLEQLPGLVDQDSAWALKVVISDNDSDDYIPDDEDDEETHTAKSQDGSGSTISADSHKVAFPSRERKSSLPLPKALSPAQLNGINPQAYDQSPKQHIKDLVKLAQHVLNTDSDEIAQEITRQGVKRFLEIKPRDWLHYTFGSFGAGKKTDSEPITAFNVVSNLLADWVVSLILCHERPRHRARQIEKFVDIAQRLRQMNNYSALRAFVAGINNATDDPTMEQFKTRSPDQAKNLKSWDLLLQQIRSHRSYRLALRNSKGACIPALEVHMSDLIRAHEGNGDTNDAYPSKIHWAKFNMMGRFIASTLQCQAQCRNSNDYGFPERTAIAELFVKIPVMSTEMQKSRLKSEDFDFDDIHPSVPPLSQPRDIAGLRRLFFW